MGVCRGGCGCLSVVGELTGAGGEIRVPHAVQLYALGVVALEPLEADLRQPPVQRVPPIPQRQGVTVTVDLVGAQLAGKHAAERTVALLSYRPFNNLRRTKQIRPAAAGLDLADQICCVTVRKISSRPDPERQTFNG